MPHDSRTLAARAAALAAAALLLAACAERATPPTAAPTGGDGGALTLLSCTADVAAGAVACRAAEPGTGDALGDARVVGGQGTFVRLASSAVAYDGAVFSFDATVQNLSTLPMATDDGTTPHADGVRVFLLTGPVATSGSGDVTVENATATGFLTAAGQPYFQYAAELGGDGVLVPGESSSAREWRFGVPGTVASFTFTAAVATHTPPGTLASTAPQVTSVLPATLVPGEPATLTGVNFDPVPANNVVTVGGVKARVWDASATTLDIFVPCTPTGAADVQVTRAGMTGVPVSHPVQVKQRTLAVGESVVLTHFTDTGCNELASADGPARYVVAVYNAHSSPNASTTVQISGDPTGQASAGPAQAAAPARTAPGGGWTSAHDRAHLRVLEANRRILETLGPRFARDPRMRPSRSVLADPVEPPLTRTFRVSKIRQDTPCTAYQTVSATRVYHSGRVAIYEDDANPVQSSTHAALASYYQAIGDQYNADMDPLVTANFGDVLRRDAVTDNNGVLVMLFTRFVNDSLPGIAGFVLGCDQFPNDEGAGDTNTASNFGEFFYAYAPTDPGTGYATFTPDFWYGVVRATVIHEAKHVVSQAARVANGSEYAESSWLEEGTARHAEELWSRESVYGVAWKANTGYGSEADPHSLYCDTRATAVCLAANPRRPSENMRRHFGGLYRFLETPHARSPFGRTASDPGFDFYAGSWSLVRYAIDRYAASEADFLGALTQSTSWGHANLAARAGVPIDQLLGEWALAVYLDDRPSLAGVSGAPGIATWNTADIFAGLKAEFPGTYARDAHVMPAQLAFGAFAPLTVSGLVGGGVAYYEFSGTQTAPQLVRLTGAAGGSLPSTIRVAIARIE